MSASGLISSLTAAQSDLAALYAADISNPFESISNAILHNSAQRAVSESSSGPLASQTMQSGASSLPSVSADVHSSVSAALSVSPFVSAASSMATSSFASSDRTSAELSISCPVAASSTQDHSDASSISISPPSEVAILRAIQSSSSAASSMSALSSILAHSVQPLVRHQRSRSDSSSGPASVSERPGIDCSRVSLSRKSSIASTTSVSSDGSFNPSQALSPPPVDPSNLPANIVLTRRGSGFLVTADDLDELYNKRVEEAANRKVEELQRNDAWTVVLYDDALLKQALLQEEAKLKKAVTDKDQKIWNLADQITTLERAINIAVRQLQDLWKRYMNSENVYFEQLSAEQAKYIMQIQDLQNHLKAAESQSAQRGEELISEKIKIEQLVKEIDLTLSNYREALVRSRDTLSDSKSCSSSAPLSSSSALSSSTPQITQTLAVPPIPARVANAQPSVFDRWCSIC